MPIIGLKEAQKRATEVGRIRLGVKTIGANGKERPQKLSTLRFTSAAKHLIDEISRLYGGEVKPWQAPSGPQFEVITTTDSVPVYVGRQLIDPWYEMGGNGYIQRRCDGETEVKRNVPCLCNADNRDCKPTTRLKVYLADVPGNGVFRLESHGWNFAEELGGDMADWIATLPDGIRLPGLLKVEPRREKKLVIERGEEKIKTFDYMVPVLYFDQITSRQIAGGPAAYAPALGGADRPAIAGVGAPTERVQAIAATPEPQVDYFKLSNEARDADTVRTLWKQAHQGEALDARLADHLKARVADLEPPDETETPPAPNGNGHTLTPSAVWRERFVQARTGDEIRSMWTQAGQDGALDDETRAAYKVAAEALLPPRTEGAPDWAALIDEAPDLPKLLPLMEAMNEAKVSDPALKQQFWVRKRELSAGADDVPAAAEVVAAEVEPDPDATWAAVLKAGADLGWNTPMTSKAFREEMGRDVSEADGWALAQFLEWQKGQAR